MRSAILLSLIQLGLIVFPTYLAADNTQKFETILEDQQTEFLARIFDGKAIDVPDAVQILPTEKKLWDIWRGNRSSIQLAVDKLHLDFKRSVEVAEPIPNTDNQADQLFALDFNFSDGNMVLRHSRPMFLTQAGGFRLFSADAKKARRFFYRANGNGGIVVLLPRFSSNEQSRGALLCPRDFIDKGSHKDKSALRDIGYSISAARAEVSGQLQGFLSNAVDYVLARVGLYTSSGVAAPRFALDEAYSHDAEVELRYRPSSEGIVTTPGDFSNMALGLGGLVELQLATGYKRISHQQAVVFVKRVDLKQEFIVPVLIAELGGTALQENFPSAEIIHKGQGVMDVRVLPGSCYLVLNYIGPIIHEYLKEPFQFPPELGIGKESKDKVQKTD